MVDPNYIARLITAHPDVMTDEGVVYSGRMITETAQAINFEQDYNKLGEAAKTLLHRMLGQYQRLDNYTFEKWDINEGVDPNQFEPALNELLEGGFVVLSGDGIIRLNRTRADSISTSYSGVG
jgi:hypothetical protein